MKKIIYLIAIIVFPGCIKDYVSQTSTYFVNETSHVIEIKPYFDGKLDSTNYKTLNSKETLEVFSNHVYGKTLAPDFGTLLQPYDSVVVVFDGIKNSVHLKFNTNITNGNYIWFNSTRSISNPQNYIKTIENETKYTLVGNFKYTFTEQDYLDAQ